MGLLSDILLHLLTVIAFLLMRENEKDKHQQLRTTMSVASVVLVIMSLRKKRVVSMLEISSLLYRVISLNTVSDLKSLTYLF